MKSRCFREGLAEAIACLIQGFIPAIQAGDEGDWLPTPDGYVWPDAGEVKSDITTEEAVRLASLPPTLRDELAGHEIRKSEGPDPFVRILKADLNDDGVDEIFVDTLYGGTGGSVYEIFAKSGNRHRSIGGCGDGARLLRASHGWYQIETLGRAGGGSYSRSLLRYVDGEYRIVRNEIHHFSNRTVEITVGEIKPPEADKVPNP